MAKKNFKGGLDSLIENSLGIKKSRKGEMKGNPVDLIKPEQTDDNDEVLAKPRTPKPKSTEVKSTENTEVKSTESTEIKSTESTEIKSTESTEVKKEVAVAEPEVKAVAEPEVKAEPEKTESVEEPLEFENVIEPDDEPVEPVEPAEPADPVEPIEPEEPAVPVEDNRKVMTVSLDAADDDSTKTAYLKEVISDLRHELFLWRNGTINVQTFNATLHTHGLKYNPENNEIEEFDTV